MRYRFDGFEFSVDEHLLSKNGEAASLRPLTAQLLHYLIERAPSYVSSDELLEHVWKQQSVSTRTVSQTMHELRSALGGSSKESKYIETKYRVGYRFVAEVTRLDAPPQKNQSAASDAATAQTNANEHESTKHPVVQTNTSQRTRSLASSRWPLWGIGALLLALAVWFAMRPDGGTDKTTVTHSLLSAEHLPTDSNLRSDYFVAMEALDDHRYREAEQRLRAVLKSEPDGLAAITGMAETMLRSGNRDEALTWADRALALSEKLPRSDQLRLEALKAATQFKWAEAEAKLQGVFQNQPGDADIGMRLFDVQLRAGMTDAGERTLSTLANSNNPLLQPYRLSMAQAQLQQVRGNHRGRLEAAQKAEAQAATTEAKHQAQLAQVPALIGLGESKQAGQLLASLQQPLGADTKASPNKLRYHLARQQWLRGAGQFDDAMNEGKQAVTVADALGDVSQKVTAQGEMAWLLTQQGKPAEALALIEQLQKQAKPLNNPRIRAGLLELAAEAWQKQGNSAKSLEHAQQAHQLFAEAGDRKGMATMSNHIGTSYARQQKLAEAETWFTRMREAFQQLGNKQGEATAISNLAIVYGQTGRGSESRAMNEQALAIYQDIQSAPNIARLQFNLSIQDRRNGHIASAQKRMADALAQFTAMGAEGHRLRALSSLGELHLMLGDFKEAATLLDDVSIPQNATPLHRSALLTAQAKLALYQQRFEASQSLFHEAKNVRSEHKLMDWLRVSNNDLAELAAAQTQAMQTIQPLRQTRSDSLGKDPSTAIDAGLLLARALMTAGQMDEAKALLPVLDGECQTFSDQQFMLRLRALQALASKQSNQELQQVAKQAREAQFMRLAWQLDALAKTPDPIAALNEPLKDERWSMIATLR